MARRNPDILAAEYVLGTLSVKERRSAETRREKDKAFAKAITGWEKRLGVLGVTTPETSPPASLWRALEAEISPADMTASTEQDMRNWPAGIAAQVEAQMTALQHSLALWRSAAVGAAAFAAAIAILWFGGMEPPMVQPALKSQYVAMLQGDRGRTGFLVTVEPEKQRLMIRSMGPEAPESMRYELWLIKPDGSEPATLGFVSAGDFMIMDVPDPMKTAKLGNGIKLAISLESESGAPSGNAMGPVVFAGKLMKQTP